MEKYQDLIDQLDVELQLKFYEAIFLYERNKLERTGSDSIQVIKSLKSLLAKDEHLNNIPLGVWDALTPFIPLENLTLAEKVVMIKRMVRDEIQRITKL